MPAPGPSDSFIILDAVAACAKDYNLDRVSSGSAVTETTAADALLKRAQNEATALKSCEAARAILKPMLAVEDARLKASIGKLDSCFATRERLHKQTLEMLDRIASGKGHASVSEGGIMAADAAQALDLLTHGTTELFVQLLPSLPPGERKLLADRITTRFPSEQKVYDDGGAETKLAEEVWIMLKLRAAMLAAP